MVLFFCHGLQFGYKVTAFSAFLQISAVLSSDYLYFLSIFTILRPALLVFVRSRRSLIRRLIAAIAFPSPISAFAVLSLGDLIAAIAPTPIFAVLSLGDRLLPRSAHQFRRS
jgi:hypothetical protein